MAPAAATCFGKQATVAARVGLDRYGRTVARVTCAGADASADQVRSGMAWVFDRYAVDRALYAIQEEAKADRRGLWADSAPHCAIGVAVGKRGAPRRAYQ